MRRQCTCVLGPERLSIRRDLRQRRDGHLRLPRQKRIRSSRTRKRKGGRAKEAAAERRRPGSGRGWRGRPAASGSAQTWGAA